MVKVKSIYAKPLENDGRRYLVDLFWPEGLHTRYAKVDHWYKQLGPSYDLQRFEFDTANWEDYKAKYRKEIFGDSEKHKILQNLAKEAREDTITLLYGNKDPQHNHAAVLKELIEKGIR